MADKNYTLLGDAACEAPDDPLEFHKLAQGLVEMLQNAHGSTPMTLGIQAPWGMGKSSLMLQMKRTLDEHPDAFKTVWFNAWLFEGQDVLEGMIKTVLEQLDSNVLRRAMRNEKLVSVVQSVASILFGFFGFDNIVNKVWDAVNIDPRARNQMKVLLTKAMHEWVSKVPKGSPRRSIVVFVDDLDRCSPESVFTVFEAIKLYLDAPGFVFVLGMDNDIVSEAILEQKKYSKKITSEQYVEKIVQIAYNIPAATPQQMQNLFVSYAKASNTRDLFDDDGRQLILERSNDNPRRIKRFINVFILEYQLNPDSHNLEPKLLIKIIMLGMYYRPFCRLFTADSQQNVLTEFLEYEAARRKIVGQVELSEDTVASLSEIFERYGVQDPAHYPVKELLELLDANVPEDFVLLKDDAQFLALAGSFDVEERVSVAVHIKRVEDAIVNESRSEDEFSKSLDLNGLRILWLDDHPDNNKTFYKDFIKAGAEVEEPESKDDAIKRLASRMGDYHLLISNINRDKNSRAGFEDLPEIRELGNYHGPVIFFGGFFTKKDRGESVSLGAQITNDPRELYHFVQEVHRSTFATETKSPKFTSAFKHKILGLPEAEQRAVSLLEDFPESDVIEMLVKEGVGRTMAETAVANAQSGRG